MLIEASKDEPKQKEEENKADGFQSKYDFRKSLAWDSAFFTSPGVLDPEELFETLNVNDGQKGLKEPSGLPSESMAASRIAECSARRSLAWDAAFFTSPGVLNPEELFLVNNGYRKSETVTHLLPGIEQEFWKSTESDSTLDSDYSLSSLEIDLFDDMRASMQKSSKASNLLSSSCKLQSQTGIPNPHSSKRLDTTSTRVKPLPASRRSKTTADGVGKTAKEAINPSKALHGARTGEHEPSSFLKLSKEYDQVNPFSHGAIKRATLGANQMKVNDKIKKTAPGKNMSKKPCISDHGTPSPESSSSRSHTASKYLSGSVSGHSASIVKSPSSLRRKNDLAASDSGGRTPKRSLTLHKSKLIDSSQPTSLQSTPKSLSTSLSTSIDCLFSESSASLDHVNTENSSNDQLVPSGRKETRFPHQDVGRFSKVSCHLPSTVLREAKPSGLRLPSTKTGFFELGNSRDLTPNGVKFHYGLQNSSKTRTGSNHLNGTPTRARYSNLQSPRTSTRTTKLKEKKLGSPQNGTQSSGNIKPNAKIEGEKASQELRSSRTIKSSHASSFVAETDLSCESGNRFGTKPDSFRSYVERDDKGKIQAKSQMVGKSSHDQNISGVKWMF
ncbi:hypothetical protein V6N11_045580 [Hibiscus sabdariffa]|uniref:Uncharacterized protein n=1 Tax=Hibiscus sabdariffa TaxID=183260 RepID=A0ABR2Q1D6_9ROSI